MEKDYEKLLADARKIFKVLNKLGIAHYESLKDDDKLVMEEFARTYGR